MSLSTESKGKILDAAWRTLDDQYGDFKLFLTTQPEEYIQSMQPTRIRIEKNLRRYAALKNPQKIDKAIRKIEELNRELYHQISIKQPRSTYCITITSKELKTGLRNVPLFITNSSHVDPELGVFYGGRHITTLRNNSVEEVLFLLEKGTLDEPRELSDYKKETTAYQKKLQEVAQIQIPPFRVAQSENTEADPMDLLIATFISLPKIKFRTFEEEAIFFKAHMPFIIASIINTHAGWGKTPPYDPSLNLIENFVHMLQFPEKATMSPNEQERFVDFLRLFFILHLDHGGGNLSTTVAKFVASGKPPLKATLAAVAIALNAPLHGGANRSAFEMVQKASECDDIIAFIDQFLDKNPVLPGFGHAVLKFDPRWEMLADYSLQYFSNHPLIKATLAIHDAAPAILEKRKPNMRNKTPNIDLISQAALQAAGFKYPEYSTILFFAARVYGILIQIELDRKLNLPLYRPASISEHELMQLSTPTSQEHLVPLLDMLESVENTLNLGEFNRAKSQFDILTKAVASFFTPLEHEKSEKRDLYKKFHKFIHNNQIVLEKKIASLEALGCALDNICKECFNAIQHATHSEEIYTSLFTEWTRVNEEIKNLSLDQNSKLSKKSKEAFTYLNSYSYLKDQLY
jgi:citrate synthase